MSHIGIRLEMQQIVRETPAIQSGSFSYAFTRLLVDRLKEMVEANEVGNRSGNLTRAANVCAQYVNEQTGWGNASESPEGLPALIAHAESFLAIFE